MVEGVAHVRRGGLVENSRHEDEGTRVESSSGSKRKLGQVFCGDGRCAGLVCQAALRIEDLLANGVDGASQ